MAESKPSANASTSSSFGMFLGMIAFYFFIGFIVWRGCTHTMTVEESMENDRLNSHYDETYTKP